VIIGMITKSHEDTSTYNNFFILPMAFFSGTFFPIDRLPALIKGFIYLLPLTHANILLRKTTIDGQGLISLAIMLCYAAVFFSYGSRLIHNYSE
jgi:ABC-type multidrug transport system permease subunit